MPEIESPPQAPPLPRPPTPPPLEGPPLRIQVLLNAFVLDGPGRLVQGLVERWLSSPGAVVRLAAIRRGGPLEREFSAMGATTEVIGGSGRESLARLRRWAARLRREAPPDVLHTHLARADLAGPWLARQMGDPVVVSTNHGLHGWREKGRLAGLLYPLAFRLASRRMDSIVAVSCSVAEDLRRAGLRKHRIDIIPNGVNPHSFHPVAPAVRRETRQLLNLDPDEGELLLAVGNLIPLKGYETLVRALPAILRQAPRAKLLLVGEGPLAEPLQALARQLGVEKAFLRIGALSALLPRVMASADLFAHPSLTEAFGLVVTEAQACGLPVVASRVGGLAEIVRDGETGRLTPPGDSEALARAVCDLLADPQIRRRMGEAGRQRTLQLFDIRRTADDYLRLFRELREARKNAPSR